MIGESSSRLIGSTSSPKSSSDYFETTDGTKGSYVSTWQRNDPDEPGLQALQSFRPARSIASGRRCPTGLGRSWISGSSMRLELRLLGTTASTEPTIIVSFVSS